MRPVRGLRLTRGLKTPTMSSEDRQALGAAATLIGLAIVGAITSVWERAVDGSADDAQTAARDVRR